MAEGDEIAEHKISDIYSDSFCLLGLASFCTKFRVVFLPFLKLYDTMIEDISNC